MSKEKMSKTRKQYVIMFIMRCIIFVGCAWLFFFRPEEFDVIRPGEFFSRFSVLHVLWIIWIFDMLLQLLPVRHIVPLGSQKHLKICFKEIKDKVNYQSLKEYVSSTTRSAYKVFILWVLLLTVIGILYYTGTIDHTWLFMISATFYVADLVCVLIWCPFRLILGTRCCTTCRIYNWDHMMMFTPMMFIASAYSTSLLLFALAIFLVWEACVMIYPERFWEKSNASLKCSECTDKLCTQYCRKLR